MPRPELRRLVLVAIATITLGTAATLPSVALTACSKKASADSRKSYSTNGTLKSFGPDKKFANIAHDDIPGYMAAMTMSFEPESPSLFVGLQPGDRVSFTFYDDDGRRVITAITKR